MLLEDFILVLGEGRTFKCYRNQKGLKIIIPKVDERDAVVIEE